MMSLTAVHIPTRRDDRCRAEDGGSPHPVPPLPRPSLTPLFPLSLVARPRLKEEPGPRGSRGGAPPVTARKAPAAPGNGRRRRGCHVGAGPGRQNEAEGG